MSEANNNATSFSSESNLESLANNKNYQGKQQNQPRSTHDRSTVENDRLLANNISQPEASELQNTSPPEPDESLSKMNWQKVAHKLREYNRKLLKQVFRLEQEIAEIDNKFNKYIEKSQNSDLLLAKQEEEIQNYQKQIALLTQDLATSQQQVSARETAIEDLSQQCELSQQQTARLERDCTLMQESYSQKNHELIAKDREIKDLQTKLNLQQRYALQYKAELKRYQEKTAISSIEPAIAPRQNYSNKRSIQPWSTSNTSDKITLPRTKPQSSTVSRVKLEPSETIKTAAEIANWSTSGLKNKNKQTTKTTAKSQKSKSSRSKPQSLAAIDLPTFPRQI